MTEILKVLVGSHAHGLATEDSDIDYRGVYVVPTSEILSLSHEKVRGKNTHWVEGENEDATSYELGHFLFLALRCNPSILEVFMAPEVESTPLGKELRGLFPYIWDSETMVKAFGGYSLNQRKKFLDDRLGRRWKYATAYLRVLIQGIQLLETGKFTLEVPSHVLGLSIQDFPMYLRAVKRGAMTVGDVVDTAETLQELMKERKVDAPFAYQCASPGYVNEFLLKVRKENWE